MTVAPEMTRKIAGTDSAEMDPSTHQAVACGDLLVTLVDPGDGNGDIESGMFVRRRYIETIPGPWPNSHSEFHPGAILLEVVDALAYEFTFAPQRPLKSTSVLERDRRHPDAGPGEGLDEGL